MSANGKYGEENEIIISKTSVKISLNRWLIFQPAVESCGLIAGGLESGGPIALRR